MYDCTGPGGVCSGTCPTCAELFHPDTGQMQLIDVGMTSMVAAPPNISLDPVTFPINRLICRSR